MAKKKAKTKKKPAKKSKATKKKPAKKDKAKKKAPGANKKRATEESVAKAWQVEETNPWGVTPSQKAPRKITKPRGRRRTTSKRPSLERGAAFLFSTTGGRYGVVRVIRESNASDGFGSRTRYLVALTAWSGDSPPEDMSDSRLRQVQVLTHPPFDKEPHRRLGWVSSRRPKAFVPCGFVYPSHEEASGPCHSFCEWSWFPRDTQQEWRWLNERDAYLAERRAWLAELEAKQKQRKKAEQERKAKLTLSKLKNADPTARWVSRPIESMAEVRQILADCLLALRELGRKKPEARVLAILRQAVEALNRANGRRQFIDTSEREDLCAHLEDLASACGLRELGDFTFEWREW